MSETAEDLLGAPLSEMERCVLEIHEKLQALLRRDDLPPCVEANTRHALGASWQMVTDLQLDCDPTLLGDERRD